MARELVTTVHVHGHGIFGPGDKLPPEVRKLLAANPLVWGEGEDDEETRPGPSETAAAGEAVLAELEAAHRRIAELEASSSAGTGGGPAAPQSDGPPPKKGSGSSADAWANYAKANGVDVALDAKREDIVTALEKAGVPTERPAE